MQVAKALYEQCGDENGAALCEDLIQQCQDYTLAKELESQGDILAATGDCESAIEKWEAARAIYEDYSDQEMIDALNTKIANCEDEPEPEPDEGFLEKYWWLILLLIALMIILIIILAKRKKEEEEDTTFGIYPSEGGGGAKAESIFGEAEEAELEIPPVIPFPVVSKEEEDELEKFMADLEKSVEFMTPDMIKQDIKGSIKRYSSLIDRRNAMVDKMEVPTRRRADKLIKELEDRIFEAL